MLRGSAAPPSGVGLDVVTCRGTRSTPNPAPRRAGSPRPPHSCRLEPRARSSPGAIGRGARRRGGTAQAARTRAADPGPLGAARPDPQQQRILGRGRQGGPGSRHHGPLLHGRAGNAFPRPGRQVWAVASPSSCAERREGPGGRWRQPPARGPRPGPLSSARHPHLVRASQMASSVPGWAGRVPRPRWVRCAQAAKGLSSARGPLPAHPPPHLLFPWGGVWGDPGALQGRAAQCVPLRGEQPRASPLCVFRRRQAVCPLPPPPPPFLLFKPRPE